MLSLCIQILKSVQDVSIAEGAYRFCYSVYSLTVTLNEFKNCITEEDYYLFYFYYLKVSHPGERQIGELILQLDS